ncbi:hemerythrin domain-containing protein [Bradyrhizobium lablabi]|nr:hemerythrin domain-containing protein [Bradyrhizobium lablabi]
MSVSSDADDLGSAVRFTLETTHAIAVCPFHLDVTIRTGDDAAESHAVARARKLVKSDGTAWQGEALRKEFVRQLSKAADRYCPHCAMFGDSVVTQESADVDRSRSSSGDDEKETQFACEGCGDLVALERAKVREDIGSLDKDRSAFLNGSLAAMTIIERLSREHRNIEMLLGVLERELEIFDRAGRPDYEVIRAIISYFEIYPEVYHHPQEDLVFAKLRLRDPAAAARVGDLALEHQKGAERFRRVAQAIDGVLADREILRQNVDHIVREFIEHERHHMMMEDRYFFPAALKALRPEDWSEIESTLTNHDDPLFSEAAEETFDVLRARILQLEEEAEAERR